MTAEDAFVVTDFLGDQGRFKMMKGRFLASPPWELVVVVVVRDICYCGAAPWMLLA